MAKSFDELKQELSQKIQQLNLWLNDLEIRLHTGPPRALPVPGGNPYHEFFSTLLLPASVLDKTGTILDINQAWAEQTGYNRSEAVGRWLGDYVLAGERKIFDLFLHDMLATKTGQELDLVLVTRAGQTRPIHLCATYHADPRDGSERIYCYNETAPLKLNPSLTYSEYETHYRKIFRMSSEPLIVMEADTGIIRDANPACFQLYGYTREELVGKRGGDLEASPRVSLVSDGTESRPIYHQKRNGGIFPVDITSLFIEWAGKHLCVWQIQDITHRVLMEKALAKNEKKYRILLEQSSDGIILAGEDGHIIEWNRAAEELTGLHREEVIGKPLWEVQLSAMPGQVRDQTDPERLKKSTELFLETGESSWAQQTVERVVERENGEQVIMQETVFPIKTEQGYMAASIFRDVTRWKRLQQQQAELETHLQEAQEKVKQLSSLLSICARCKRIRDSEGNWERIEIYFTKHMDVRFSHGLCPKCLQEFYRSDGNTDDESDEQK